MNAGDARPPVQCPTSTDQQAPLVPPRECCPRRRRDRQFLAHSAPKPYTVTRLSPAFGLRKIIMGKSLTRELPSRTSSKYYAAEVIASLLALVLSVASALLAHRITDADAAISIVSSFLVWDQPVVLGFKTHHVPGLLLRQRYERLNHRLVSHYPRHTRIEAKRPSLLLHT